MRTEL